jgi:hypothetical protein
VTSRNPRRPAEEHAAWAVDQVMRGGNTLLPPGTIPASVMIPCLCIGVGGLVWFVVSGVTPPGADRLRPTAVAMLTPLVLMVLPLASQSLIIFGRRRWSRIFLVYVRVLLVCSVGAVAAAAFGLLKGMWWFGIVAVFGIGVSHEILRSWSYAVFTAFFALKRKFLADQRAARDRILEGVARRDG